MRLMYFSAYTFLVAGLLACAAPAATSTKGNTGTVRTVRNAPAGSIRTDDAALAALTRDTHDEINRYRRKKGLPALEWLDVAATQALNHSRSMAAGRTPFSHDGFKQRTEAIRQQFGGNAFAENVAEGYMDAKEVAQGWVNSPGHRKNIEGNFTHAGLGVAKARNGDLYYTQVFVKR